VKPYGTCKPREPTENEVESLINYITVGLLPQLQRFENDNDGRVTKIWACVKPVVEQISAHLELASYTRIGFVGARGAGKSTLINTLLGIPLFLPTDWGETCTAAISEVRRSENTTFHAAIQFITEEELSNIIAYDKDTDEEIKEKKKCLGVLTEEDHSLFSLWIKEGKELSSPSPDLLSKELDGFMNKSGRWWPLVKWIHIDGPFPGLEGLGMVSLLDIPGTHDNFASMATRNNLALEYCDAAFIMPAPQQAGNVSILKNLVNGLSTKKKGIIVTNLHNHLFQTRRFKNVPASQFVQVFRSAEVLPECIPVYPFELVELDKDPFYPTLIQNFKNDVLNPDGSVSLKVTVLQRKINNLLENMTKFISSRSQRIPELGSLLGRIEDSASALTAFVDEGPNFSNCYELQTTIFSQQFERTNTNTLKGWIRKGSMEISHTASVMILPHIQMDQWRKDYIRMYITKFKDLYLENPSLLLFRDYIDLSFQEFEKTIERDASVGPSGDKFPDKSTKINK
jgi:hypothetical protein